MRGIWLLAVLFAVASCTSETASAPAPATTTTTTTSWKSAKAPATCPVTTSTSEVRPPAPIEPTSKPVSWSDNWFGNDALWVRLAPAGVVPAGHRLDVKFPWWRATPGKLTLSGHLVGGAIGTMTPAVADGYGDRGFQVTSMTFSTAGCWSLTGEVQDKTLTVVVWIQAFDKL